MNNKDVTNIQYKTYFSDVSGGDNASILDAMRRAMDVSTLVDSNNRLTSDKVLHLATLGGAKG